MHRKLMLPLMAVLAIGAVAAPAATAQKKGGAIAGLTKSVKAAFDDIKGLKAGVDRVDDRVAKLEATVKSVTAGATGALTQLQNGVLQLKDGVVQLKEGLTTLQGAGVEIGQATVAAVGTADPNSSDAKTNGDNALLPAESTRDLPTGALYRQIVLATSGALPVGTPVGVRTWVKMPDVSALGYNNTWVCTSANDTGIASGSYDSAVKTGCT